MWVSTLILTILLLLDLMVIFILGAGLSQNRVFDWNMLLLTTLLNFVGAYLWRKSRE
ncbi:MAG: hypothetical protein RLZZ156_1078 [Deinococcota bacterium]|jgi:hypothetical protein